MNAFADLLDRLAYEPRRNAKLRMLQDFFARTPDPERGYALGAMTGTLSFREAKPALIRGLVEARDRPGAVPAVAQLCRRSRRDHGPDLALHASPSALGRLRSSHRARCGAGPPARAGGGAGRARHRPICQPCSPPPRGVGMRARGIGHNNPPAHVPTLAEVVETLATIPKKDLPGHLADWLDALDETGRWALLKLVTGNLRVGVSARLAKTAVGALGGHDADAVEEGLARAHAAVRDPVRLGGGPGRAARDPEPGPVPAADAVASDRGGGRSRQARAGGVLGRVEVGRASASSSSAAATGRAPRSGKSIRAPARTSPGRSRIWPRRSPSRGRWTGNC